MRKVFQILFFILLTVIFAVLLLLFEAKFRILTPRFVQKQLARNNVYEKLVNNSEILVQEFINKQNEKLREEAGGETEVMVVDAKEISEFIKRNFEPNWMRSQFESLSNQIYAFVLSGKQATEFKIDISGLRSNFETEIEAFARRQFEKLPEVSEKEFQKMMEKEKFPKARPKGATFEEVLSRLPENPIDILLGRIPLTLQASTEQLKDNPKANEALSSVERFRFAKRISDIIFYTGLLAILLLVALFAKLTSHTLRNFFLNVGIYLLPGFVLFFIFLVLRYMDNFLIETFLLPKIQNVLDLLKNEIFLPVLKSSYKDIMGDLMLWSFILGFAGFLMILPSLYKNKLSKFLRK